MFNRTNREPRRKVSMGKVIGAGVLFLLLVVAGIALYGFASLHISYSDGERSGLLQKFSHKGWVCKTWEGELAMSYLPGMAPVIWNFSVRDEPTVAKANELTGKKVVVHYEEHRGIPTDCFGETQYFVDGLRVLE
jgi:hypothetical protein